MPGAYFDAVLMDIQMPVMDGYAATHQIRAVLGLVDLPIIAMTAHARPQDREKSRMAGMVGHLVKPLQVDDLLDILVRSTGSRTVSEVVDVEGALS
jgi:CheY-like chemotaxis protein